MILIKTILSIFPFDLARQGGLEVQAASIINGLAEMGNTMIVILPEGSEWHGTGNVIIYRLPCAGLHVDPWRGLGFVLQNCGDIGNIIINHSIDLVHIHSTPSTAGYAYLFKKGFVIPVLLTNHGAMSDNKEYLKWRCTPTELLRQFGRILPIQWLEKLDIRSAVNITVVSRSLLHIREDAILIPNTFDPILFNLYANPSKLTWRKNMVICPGRISPEKGQQVLIEALPRIPKEIRDNLMVLFVGNDHLKSSISLLKRSRDLDINRYVGFFGASDHTNMPVLYKSADVIVVPSLVESFGLVVLENLALGNVVVASNVGGIPELIADGVNGLLVPPGNPEELAKAIVRVLTDTELRDRIKQNGPASAEKYNVKNIIPLYDALISEMVGG